MPGRVAEMDVASAVAVILDDGATLVERLVADEDAVVAVVDGDLLVVYRGSAKVDHELAVAPDTGEAVADSCDTVEGGRQRLGAATDARGGEATQELALLGAHALGPCPRVMT